MERRGGTEEKNRLCLSSEIVHLMSDQLLFQTFELKLGDGAVLSRPPDSGVFVGWLS